MMEPMSENAEQYETQEQNANKKARLQWVIIAAVVAILACGLATAVAVAVGRAMYFKNNDQVWEDSGEKVIERSFRVGEDAELVVDSFAGAIKVVGSDTNKIEITATKRSRWKDDLSKVTVDMSQSGDAVRVVVKRKGAVNNTSVEIVALVPEHTLVDLHTGAGNVTVERIENDVEVQTNAGDVLLGFVEGTVDAQTNAGAVRADAMRGPVRLQTNAGNVDYEGEPWDKCTLQSNAGSVTLHLPADLDAKIDARSNAGSVDVDFKVKGTVDRDHVKGKIGSGGRVDIEASTNAGAVRVYKR